MNKQILDLNLLNLAKIFNQLVTWDSKYFWKSKKISGKHKTGYELDISSEMIGNIYNSYPLPLDVRLFLLKRNTDYKYFLEFTFTYEMQNNCESLFLCVCLEFFHFLIIFSQISVLFCSYHYGTTVLHVWSSTDSSVIWTINFVQSLDIGY